MVWMVQGVLRWMPIVCGRGASDGEGLLERGVPADAVAIVVQRSPAVERWQRAIHTVSEEVRRKRRRAVGFAPRELLELPRKLEALRGLGRGAVKCHGGRARFCERCAFSKSLKRMQRDAMLPTLGKTIEFLAGDLSFFHVILTSVCVRCLRLLATVPTGLELCGS